ncbi:MAG: ABC transporter permease [Clostridiaceae bacterium]
MLTLNIVQSALELGFIYALVALALFLSFSILNIADLTTDGTFTLGCAISAVVCIAGHPILAILAAIVAGALAGYVTAFLQTKLGVPSILAGIITNVGLYSINLAVMGFSSNLSLFKVETIFTLGKTYIGGEWYKLIIAAAITIIIGAILYFFLNTTLGMSVRATGDNPDMVRASSINPSFTITVGLCIANGMTGLSGAILGQYQRSSDINLGTGMVVIGLASLIIGETLLGKRGIARWIFAAIFGSLLYRLIIALALRFDIPSEMLKLVSAVIVGIAIALPALKENIALRRQRAQQRKKRYEGGKSNA